ncbi:hypothetical protein BDQ17DRAFT_1405786 [Cyathus striatus]|nr:hypothetical protein BDQ17DRAFT_1405786 [Cyathus striatus]
MSTNTSVETASLVGVACNAILYGVHLVVFPICMFILIQKRLKGVSIHWILICALAIQFVLSTAYISVQLFMTFQSFVRLQPHDSTLTSSSPSGPQSIIAEPSPTWWNTPPIPSPTAALLSSVSPNSGPILTSSVSGWGSPNQQWSPIAMYWLDTRAKIQILSSAICFFNTIMGDSILIWRLYFVWKNQRIVCLLPIASLIASVICAALMIGIQSASIYSVVDKLAMASWALSIGTQLIATFLIAFKLWPARRFIDKLGLTEAGNPYKRLVWIFVESGAIYSAMALALLIFFSIRKLDAAVVLMGCMGQTAAIIPATIVILTYWPLTPPTGSTGSPSTISGDDTVAFASIERQNTHSDDGIPTDSAVGARGMD